MPGPDLSPETIRRIDILFPPADRERVRTLLCDQCGGNLSFLEEYDMYRLERFRFAALKFSDGDFVKLEHAVQLAKIDWRDLLVAAGFANDVEAHRTWEPKPAGEPSQIDPVRLAEAIHDRIAPLLAPMGFERHGEDWLRAGDVPQILSVQTGLASRIEVTFFARAILEAKPLAVLLQMPRLKDLKHFGEQGYIFRAGESMDALAAAVLHDVTRYAVPWFERFTSNAEVQDGFDDRTFHPHIPVEGKAIIF